jgi:putative hydrolase of the HAD superfamily
MLNSFLLSGQKNLNEMAKKVAELFVKVLAVAGVSIFSTMLMPLPQDICWAKLLTIPIFEIYEEGKITLQEYLSLVVFHKKRPFTRNQFWRFMFAQSKPFPEMIELVAQLKLRLGMKIAIISNEGRELNAYRIRKFKLDRFVDCFISSCYVHIRKPDADIFRLALDIAQVQASQAVYIENTPMFVQIAEGLGIPSILHTDCKSTRAGLYALGLNVADSPQSPDFP